LSAPDARIFNQHPAPQQRSKKLDQAEARDFLAWLRGEALDSIERVHERRYPALRGKAARLAPLAQPDRPQATLAGITEP
jgi:hypothetical protein